MLCREQSTSTVKWAIFLASNMLDWNHGFDNCLYLLMMKHLGFLWKEIYPSAVWRGSWTSASGQKPWNIQNLSGSLSHSWLSPTSAWGRVAAGTDQGTKCRKISYKCQWCRKERWGKWLITLVKRSQAEFLRGGVTVALHNWHLLWQSQKDSIPSLVVGTLLLDVVKSWKVVLGQYRRKKKGNNKCPN